MRYALPILLALLPELLAAQTTVPDFKARWRVSSCDSTQQGDGYPEAVIDGNPETFWHTEWRAKSPPHPHEIAVDMGRAVELVGFTYCPRQAKGGSETNGRIDRYEFLVSGDNTNWTQAVRGRFTESGTWQTNRFPQAMTARYFKLVSWSAFKGQPWAAVGELDVLVSEKTAAGLRSGK